MYAVVAIAGVVVLAALAVVTYRTVQLENWSDSATTVGTKWARDHGERLVVARFDGATLVLVVEGNSDGSQDASLTGLLSGELPAGTPVVVNRVPGSRREIGDVAR